MHLLLLLAMCAAAIPGLSYAQMNDFDTRPQGGTVEDAGPERKRSRFWFRPKMETATEQLMYAQTLEVEGKIKAAGKAYRELVSFWHESPEALIAQRGFARTLEKRAKHADAFDELQYLFDFFPGKFDYEEALNEQYRIANLIAAGKRGDVLFFNGWTRPERALPLYEKIVANGPRWSRAAEVRFRIGQIQEKIGEVENACKAYEVLGMRHPKTVFAAESALRRAYCLETLALKRPRNEKALLEAMRAFEVFLSRYPDHDGVEGAAGKSTELMERLATLAFQQAEFYDKMVKKSAAALIAYRNFIQRYPTSRLAPQASLRIQILTKELGRDENEG
ncbi:MAG: tetratricopeptide repeat protein [Kiritimatiellae bacterium]|nr:tetratricopeptide repeat protein [Kiritimatiellia bacterium]